MGGIVKEVKIMKCKKCENDTFRVQVIPCCHDCDQNPAYDPDLGYTTDLKVIAEKELVRDGVENDGECDMGNAYGAGCYQFICTACNTRDHLPVVEGC